MSSSVGCQQQEAVVGFADASLAVSVTEGSTAVLTVTREGTLRECVAKDASVITCGAPADGATECPDYPDDCVFTAGVAGSTQGTCALTDQAACTASIDDDEEGESCMALKCEYTHGSLGVGSIDYTTVDGTAFSTRLSSPTAVAAGLFLSLIHI